MVTCSRLSIQQSSPIHESAPIVSRHGYFTLTPGLMTTPGPIRAPNNRSRDLRTEDEGLIDDLIIGRPKKNHMEAMILPRPGLYQELSNVLRSTLRGMGQKMQFRFT